MKPYHVSSWESSPTHYCITTIRFARSPLMINAQEKTKECMSKVHFPSGAPSLYPRETWFLQLLLLFAWRCHIVRSTRHLKKLQRVLFWDIFEHEYANRFAEWKFYSNLIDSDTPWLTRKHLVINLSPEIDGKKKQKSFTFQASKLFNYQPWHRNDLHRNSIKAYQRLEIAHVSATLRVRK